MKRATIALVATLAACAHRAPAPSSPAAPSEAATPVAAAPVLHVDQEWRGTVPTFATEWPAFEPPPLLESRLPNGMTLYVVALPSSSTVVAGLLTRAGSAVEPANRPGLAALSWNSLANGSGAMGETALGTQLAHLGTSLVNNVDARGTALSLVVQPRDTRAAVELLSTLVRATHVDDQALAQLRRRMSLDLVQAAAVPAEIAHRALLRDLLGADHVLARQPAGSPEALAKLGADDVRAFVRQWIAPDTAALVLAGPIDVAGARQLAEAVFGGWRGEAKPLPAVAPPRHARSPLLRVAQPGFAQALIHFGRVGVPTSDLDHAPFMLLTLQLSELLHYELQVRQGLTFEASVAASADQDLGLLVGGIWVRPERASKALDTIATQMRMLLRYFFIDGDVTKRNLRNLKATAAANLIRRYDGVDGAFANARYAFWQREPADWLARYVQSLDLVNGADMRRVIGRYLAPDDLHVVLLADPAQLATLPYAWPPPPAVTK